jgi:hypothetical protein
MSPEDAPVNSNINRDGTIVEASAYNELLEREREREREGSPRNTGGRPTEAERKNTR